MFGLHIVQIFVSPDSEREAMEPMEMLENVVRGVLGPLVEMVTEFRKSNPLGYVPVWLNELLVRLSGSYTTYGVVVKVGDKYAFHVRPTDDGSPWAGMGEWPDVQLTPKMSRGQVEELLRRKGLGTVSPEDIFKAKVLGFANQDEGERGARCFVMRVLIELPNISELSGEWILFSDEELREMAETYSKGESIIPIVDYHLAAALWVLDGNRSNFANVREYLWDLPKGPFD